LKSICGKLENAGSLGPARKLKKTVARLEGNGMTNTHEMTDANYDATVSA